jgi:hypothetical protein
MIKYSLLKNKILQNFSDLNKTDFYLLEGKIIFKEKQKALMIKDYLENNYGKIQLTKANNHKHWNSKYEIEIYFNDLPKGMEA